MCDTFVVTQEKSLTGNMLFGKNSDREANEAQLLEFYPAQEHEPGSQVQCTYIRIPQVQRTNPILLSRPWWMWGGEIGVNAAGVVIGNEAVWSRIPSNRESALLGMDLLRLALERGDSSREARDLIIELLAEHGQGGNCGMANKLYYHNSFLLADAHEAWILETVDRMWITRRIQGFGALSNGYSIGREYDALHPDLIDHARKKSWLKVGADFDFAAVYGDRFYTTFSACRTRRARSEELLAHTGYGLTQAFDHLRDHGDVQNYRPDRHFLMKHVCAHAGARPARQASQSTAYLVVEIAPDGPHCCATAGSGPCTALFKPITMQADVLPQTPADFDGTYHEDVFWWRHELLHRTALMDFPTRQPTILEHWQDLEHDWINRAFDPDSDSREMCRKAFQREEEITGNLLGEFGQIPVRIRPVLPYRRFWGRQNRAMGVSAEPF